MRILGRKQYSDTIDDLGHCKPVIRPRRRSGLILAQRGLVAASGKTVVVLALMDRLTATALRHRLDGITSRVSQND